ncbi:MAG: pirin family protein [Alphaproteobacteria bacterium]|nr:pirin family protein [Alphaproteobacteria bacterium]
MLTIRPAASRGQTTAGWLDSRHSFSFADYYDPDHMGYRSLRVINDDSIKPGAGFPTHGHRDMEIVTFVMQGALAHKDSLGNGASISPGEIQRMSAGTGIRHSEFNPSNDNPTRLLQIWIIPEAQGTEPGYEQKHYDKTTTSGRFGLIGSRDGRDGSVQIRQDVNLYCAHLPAGITASFALPKDRFGWLQVAEGTISANEQELTDGDGASWNDPASITFKAKSDSTILLFDLA